MRSFHALIFTLLCCQSFGRDVVELPRKHNTVSTYVNKILGQIFDEIFGTNFISEEIDLGEEVGKFLNVELVISGGLTKAVDGHKSWGFKLDTTVTGIVLKGQYDLVHLDIPGLFPFFGKGDFSVTVDFVNLNMILQADYDFGEDKFKIDLPRFNILVKNSTVNFENLMNDPHLADFLNELLSNLLPDLVIMFADPLLELGKPLIEYYGNGIINCIKTRPFDIENCIKDLFEISGLEGRKIIPSKFSINLNKYLNVTPNPRDLP